MTTEKIVTSYIKLTPEEYTEERLEGGRGGEECIPNTEYFIASDTSLEGLTQQERHE